MCMMSSENNDAGIIVLQDTHDASFWVRVVAVQFPQVRGTKAKKRNRTTMDVSPARPTMQDVANHAGVTRATVSLALHNDPKLPETTRRRIHEIAAKLGYHPSPLYSVLMAQCRRANRTQNPLTLAYISSQHRPDGDSDSRTLRRLHQGATTRAEQMGYRLEELVLDGSGMVSSRVNRILASQGLRGVLIAPFPKTGEQLTLNWPWLASVSLGYTLTHPNLHRVAPHYMDGMMTLLTNLNNSGFHRIGLALSAEADRRTGQNWSAGLLTYQRHVPIADRCPMLVIETWNQRKFAHWFERHRPDVLVTHDRSSAQWLIALGYRIPQDIGFVILDWNEEMAGIAGIDQCAEAVGAAGVDLLAHQIEQNEFGVPSNPQTVLIEGAWVTGDTVIRPSRESPLSRVLIERPFSASPHHPSFPTKARHALPCRV